MGILNVEKGSKLIPNGIIVLLFNNTHYFGQFGVSTESLAIDINMDFNT